MTPAQDRLLERAQREAFRYFEEQEAGALRLTPDTTRPDSPISIAGVGFALTTFTVGVYRGYISRERGIELTLRAMRFFANSEQSDKPNATGYKGFYYHFLDRDTGRRQWNSELSVIDTALLIAGCLSAASFYDGSSQDESEIRDLAHRLYARVDWRWAQGGREALSHGWRPETGFLHYEWYGYSEALLLYTLALGAPELALERDHYAAWTVTYQWENLFGYDVLYAGPLFIHQFSQAWIDFRGIRDAFMREKQSDYFENSRRATYVQQAYAERNPKSYRGYGPLGWGLTAGKGPGFFTRRIDDFDREFYSYVARAVPYGPDDGTLGPPAVLGSLPFAPEIAIPTIEAMATRYPEVMGPYGFRGSVNPTLVDDKTGAAWVVDSDFALDTGLIVLMVENFRSNFVTDCFKRCPSVAAGLRKAGFTGGWLDGGVA